MSRSCLLLCVFAIGLLSILAQVLLLRELGVAFYGVELVYVLGLGAWLLFTAFGAAVSHRRLEPSGPGVAALFVLLGAAVPAGLGFLRAARELLSGVPGAFLPFERGLLALVLGLAPTGALLGLLFQWVARLVIARGGSLAEAYAVESLGGLAGGAGVTLALARGVSATALALVVPILAILVPLPLLRVPGARLALALLALPPLGLLGSAAELDLRLSRLAHRTLVESRDSPYARISVSRRGGQTALFVNDALAFETESSEPEAFVHPVLLQHPAPKAIAVLGGCFEGLAREALAHAPSGLDCVEIDPALVEIGRRHVGGAASGLLDPRVRLHLFDPRRFLEPHAPFDAILVGAADPDTGQANRLFTSEFFELCARSLRPGGVLGLRLRSAESFLSPQLARRNASVVRALSAAFADTVLLPGAAGVAVASASPLVRDPAVLAARLLERGVAGRLARPEYIEYVYDRQRIASIASRLAAADALPNRDGRPVCYSFAATLWLSRLVPRLAFSDALWLSERAVAAAALLALAASALGFAALRRRPRARRVALVGVAGLVGMAAESVLLLHYQATRGALFQDLGVLITAFMAGLAAGAWWIGRPAPGPGEARRGARLVLGLAALSLSIAWETRAAALTGLPGIGLLLLLAGALVGGVLAHASRMGFADPGDAVSPLYAADLLGGSLGGLAASLLLIPILGLEATAAGMALLALAALLLV